jgi:Competence protein CoiA-like family
MLVAYGPEGQRVVAEEARLETLQRWSRERVLQCPNCKGIVHVRGGAEKRTQLHFAHQKGECAWSTEAESVRHASGKVVLANWLREQFPRAVITFEERLPEPDRIADVFLVHPDGRRWAIEFQCAPLEVEEWRHRHEAYRAANILDVWIIGDNRREKQEAFIEAILSSAREVMFLNPLLTPPRIWLRWPVGRDFVEIWRKEMSRTLMVQLAGWVGRMGYGATVVSQMQDVRLGEEGGVINHARTALETQMHLVQSMGADASIDEATLSLYLSQRISQEAIRLVIVPLVRAYVRDPDLLRRYNYGRGQGELPVSEDDVTRVKKARQWVIGLERVGFSQGDLRELVKEVPFVGLYAALVGYMEMLIGLVF